MINRRRKGVLDRAFVFNLIKILLCATSAFAVAKSIYPLTAFLDGSTLLILIRLCLAALPSGVVFLLLSFVLKTEEMQTAVQFLKKRKD